MSKCTTVWVTATFTGFHRWLGAPEHTAFLRSWHRHVFHVRLGVRVGHSDRQVEFFALKEELGVYLKLAFEGQKFEHSCEHLAEKILDRFTVPGKYEPIFAEVSEDGENGAVIECPPAPALEPPATRETPQEALERGVYGQLPSALVRERCFVGTEAEGPHRGLAGVLYVPGAATPAEFEGAFRRHRPPRVYYGAGNDRRVSRETLSAVLTAIRPSCVDVEVSGVPAWLEEVMSLPGNEEMTVISLDPADRGRSDYVKYEYPGHFVWVAAGDTCEAYATRRDDPLYALDREA